MSDRTERPICVVTGAAGALGSAVAKHLAKEDYRLALFDVEAARERLTALAEELGATRACHVTGDFGLATTWREAIAKVSRTFGAPPSRAALIAGGYAGGVPVHEAKDDTAYEHMMKINVDPTYHAFRALLPSMVEARDGSIVVIGSKAVERPWTSANAAAYGASKAAVVAMAKAVAAEVEAYGVRVNAILPSTLDTPANRRAMPDADPSAWVSLDSAAGVVAFLLSNAARDVSGTSLPVHGRS